MKKPKQKPRMPFLEWMAKIHSNYYTQIEHATIIKTTCNRPTEPK